MLTVDVEEVLVLGEDVVEVVEAEVVVLVDSVVVVTGGP
jgi:hypothetical protein